VLRRDSSHLLQPPEKRVFSTGQFYELLVETDNEENEDQEGTEKNRLRIRKEGR
jgi:hypothetical protein